MIAGERAAGAVGAVHSGRQSHDEQACPRVAEWRDRPCVIVGMVAPDLVKKPGQPRAGAAIRSKLHFARALRAVKRQLAGLDADGADRGDRLEITRVAV